MIEQRAKLAIGRVAKWIVFHQPFRVRFNSPYGQFVLWLTDVYRWSITQ